MHQTLLPPGWPRPKGYANGVAARGRLVFVAGQVGWTEREEIATDDFVGQVRQALLNIRAILNEAGAKPEHLVRMTWYVADKDEYVSNLPRIGEAYRSVMGRVFPAMTLIEVKGLLEERAKVEIEATAVIPDAEPRDWE